MSDQDGTDFVPTTHHDTYPAIHPSRADITGRVVLVTGSSRGIGRATAIAFAQAGASGVVLLARGDTTASADEVRAARRPASALEILCIAADITDPKQAKAAITKVKERFGRLDVLVNNAGYFELTQRLVAESDPEEWWKTWEVNVRGTYNMTRAALPLLIECGGNKTIVNISSRVAHWTIPTWSAYEISKLAVLRFTEQIVSEYADKGILAYGVHPCATPTELNSSMGEENRKRLIDTPEVAAHTIVWLVKDRREWLNGRYYSCLWDVDEVLAKKDEIVAGDKLKYRMAV